MILDFSPECQDVFQRCLIFIEDEKSLDFTY